MLGGMSSCWTVAVAPGGSVPLWACGLCPHCGELCCGGVWGFIGLGGMSGSGIYSGDVRPGGCILVQVELQRWWPNRVPHALVVVRVVELDALLSKPAVVGEDGVRDGVVVVVPERAVGLRTVLERGANCRR